MDVRPSPVNRNRRGFSMVESLVAVAIVAIAGAALLTSVGAAVRGADDAQHLAIARGLADQMIDEISAMRFPASGTASNLDATDRSTYDDVDDYAGYSETPPRDRQGRRIGEEAYDTSNTAVVRLDPLKLDRELMNRFTRHVSVQRVDADGASGWNVVSTHTDYRRVTVTVEYTDFNNTRAELARVTRIFTDVDAAP